MKKIILIVFVVSVFYVNEVTTFAQCSDAGVILSVGMLMKRRVKVYLVFLLHINLVLAVKMIMLNIILFKSALYIMYLKKLLFN